MSEWRPSSSRWPDDAFGPTLPELGSARRDSDGYRGVRPRPPPAPAMTRTWITAGRAAPPGARGPGPERGSSAGPSGGPGCRAAMSAPGGAGRLAARQLRHGRRPEVLESGRGRGRSTRVPRRSQAGHRRPTARGRSRVGSDRAVGSRRECRVAVQYDPWAMTTLPLILDCDTGIDDSLALLYACASPDAELVAVTCVGGNVDARQVAHEHARRARAGRPNRHRGRARARDPARPAARHDPRDARPAGPRLRGAAAADARAVGPARRGPVHRRSAPPTRRGDARHARAADEPCRRACSANPSCRASCAGC